MVGVFCWLVACALAAMAQAPSSNSATDDSPRTEQSDEAGEGAAAPEANDPAAPRRQIPGVEHISAFSVGLMALFLVPIFYFIRQAQKGRKLFLRRLPGVDAIDEAIGRAVEMGRPIMFTTGLTGVGPQLFACLGVLSHVAQRAATYGARLYVPSVEPEVMAISQDVIHQAHRAVDREDSYDPDTVRYLSSQQFAFASGYMGMAHRERVAACFLFGFFAAESLILAEAGQQVGAIQVAGTATNEQIPFFVTTCDFTIIGEELYAVSAYLSREPVLLGSLRGQDIAKLVVFALVITGVVLATIFQATGYDLDFATWIIPLPK
jgi:hypothetical protein